MNVDTPLKLVPLNERNASDWNRYVSSHPLATPYHNAAWQRVSENVYAMQCEGLLAINEQDDRIVGVVPAVKLTSWVLGERLCALPYCDVGFPLADSPDIEAYLLANLKEKHASAKYFEVRGCHAQQTADNSFLAGKKVQMRLPLPDSSDVLLKSFKSKLRSQIKKADKNGLTSKGGNSPELVNDFYTVYVTNMRDLGSPAHSLEWFLNISRGYDAACYISVVYHDDAPIGAGIVLKNNDKASIPWASTVREFNKLAPNMKLYWSVLAHCADNGIREFDFGRSTFNEGTFKFKKQWGAEPYLLDWYHYPRSNVVNQQEAASNNGMKESTKAMAERVWRKLPLPLSVAIGKRIRPHISL